MPDWGVRGAMDLGIDSRLKLNDGNEIPVLGLGVWRASPGRETQGAVRAAMDLGYRLIDTASMYGNERDVGRAVRESGVPREDVFVTTKLWNDDHGYESAIAACRRSLRELGLDYVDLYLIHWPASRLRSESWRALVKLREEGLCRSIGVSNYMVPHLEEVLAESPVVPAVDQVEFHPFLNQSTLLEFGRENGIQVEAYSPLTRGRRLHDRRVVAIAERHRRTPAQVLIRWGLQHGLVEIPKSVRPERIRENAQVFDFALAAEEMAALDAADERMHVSWDPTSVP